MDEDFFEEAKEQSTVKTTIVKKYFAAWAKVMVANAKRYGQNKIGYLDLFAGPGYYEDGTASTPILIIQEVLKDPDLCELLLIGFNDRDPKTVRDLETAINQLAGIEKLKHKPKVYNEEVGKKIAERFAPKNLIPTLLFVDPWGYKGMSLELISSFLKDWGSDCIFFFNYNRINMGLSNTLVKEHMDALFGEERADQLRDQLIGMNPTERELAILEGLLEALRDRDYKYVLPFRFKSAAGSRTSHHLIFVSKHVRGYEIMKEIMAKESSTQDQGVPSFEYCPADQIRHPMLFELARPLDDLQALLLERFAGQKLKMSDVYQHHNVGTPYIKRNYKDVLRKMESAGRIKANPSAAKRQVRNGQPTFADSVVVTFPKK